MALEWLKGKNKLSGIVLTDGAHVLLANFKDERSSVPMHINCASARPVEVAELHDRLLREFIHKRDDYVRESYYGEFVWKGRKKFKPFTLPEPAKLPLWADWLANAFVAVILVAMAWGFYELLCVSASCLRPGSFHCF